MLQSSWYIVKRLVRIYTYTMRKIFSSLILIFLIVEFHQSIAETEGNNAIRNHLEIGDRVDGDKLLLRRTVRKKPSKNIFGGWIATTTEDEVSINLSKISGVGKHTKITSVRIEQQYESSFVTARVYATVLKGGTNTRRIKLLLTSERGYGFNYEILVYGK